MQAHSFQLNLLVAWAAILLGFLSGMVMGLFFHREDWLGGYASHKRRMYRLGHISFFGLGTVNLLFWLTSEGLPTGLPAFASWMFVLGAITMPVCCAVMAHFSRARLLFAVPVVSLFAGGAATLLRILKL